MDRLLASGRTVMLETGGHRPTTRVPAAVVKIVDVKCPGSGEAARNDWSNLDRLEPHDEVKFVVQDRADYEFARDVIARHDLPSRAAAVLMSPVHGVLEPEALVGVDARRPPARPAAAAAAQIHLVADHARCLNLTVMTHPFTRFRDLPSALHSAICTLQSPPCTLQSCGPSSC